MSHTDILLVKPVPNIGKEGEQVRVKSGYARNYLLPRKLAVPATLANRRQIEALEKRRAEREAVELESSRGLQEKIDALRLAIVVKTGEGGKMFGAVTVTDLLEKLKENDIEVDRKQIHLPNPVKSLGDHSIEVKLHSDITATLKFEVVSENPIED
jgi:large subunit ribosomal protein L9